MNLKEKIRADIESHEIMACHNIESAMASINFALVGLDEENTSAGYNVKDGVATVNIRGLLVPNMSFDASEYGITGYNHITGYIEQANADPTVKNIVLDVDSGGGYVAGINEPTEAIANSSKPVETFVSGSMYSAAYWLGATAETVTANKNGGIGSIGVYNVHMERSKAYEDNGVKMTMFRSGKWKGAFNDFTPLSDDESKALQASVDDQADIFFNHVATSRNISASRVAGWDGNTFDAGAAKSYGLIDTIAEQPKFNQMSEEDSMTLEQAQAEITGLKAQLSAKDAELQAFQTTQRDSDIKALSEKTGIEFTAEEKEMMQSLNGLAFKLTSSLIPAKAIEPAKPALAIFGEQAIQGKTTVASDDLDANISKWAGV